jgi:hypothetical protein
MTASIVLDGLNAAVRSKFITTARAEGDRKWESLLRLRVAESSAAGTGGRPGNQLFFGQLQRITAPLP